MKKKLFFGVIVAVIFIGIFAIFSISKRSDQDGDIFPELSGGCGSVTDYASGIHVKNNRDAANVFKKYIAWAKENNADIFGYGNRWRVDGASADGIYGGLKLWTIRASRYSEEDHSWKPKIVFSVNENGEVIRLLGCI